jgi:hypothetical protein
MVHLNETKMSYPDTLILPTGCPSIIQCIALYRVVGYAELRIFRVDNAGVFSFRLVFCDCWGFIGIWI